MKATQAKPGKPIVMKLREDEETLVTEWLNLQDKYSDSIRYLIQKEIAENGLRNLQLYIPQKRTIETIKAQLAVENKTVVYELPNVQSGSNLQLPTTVTHPIFSLNTNALDVNQVMRENAVTNEEVSSKDQNQQDSPVESNDGKENKQGKSRKKAAKKTFDADSINSFS